MQRNEDAVVEGDAVSESPRRFDSFEDGAAAARSGEEAPPVAGAVAEKVRNASDFGKFIPAFEYRLISLRDKNPEALLSYGDALGALFYLANPSKTEGFLEAAERLRIFLLDLSDEERELTTNHLRGYLRILMKKEGLEIDDALDLCLEREEADVMLTYMQKEFRKARKEGREEGREEGQLEKGISMALAMLEAGEPEEKILRYTGLSLSQLEEIRDGKK